MKKLLLLGLLTITATQSALAGNEPGKFTFTIAEGAYWFAQKRHVDNIGMPNAALAYNVDERWAAEIGMGLINTNQKHFNEAGVHGFLYTLDALYRFHPHERFEPYASMGIGTIGMSPNGNTSEWLGNINAGLGTQWFMDKSVAFKGELRDLYTISGGFNDVMLNVGVSFLFG